MYLKILILSAYFITIVFSNFHFIKIEPIKESHDRRYHVIVTCNASTITENIVMFFQYNEINYTVPRINNVPGIYSGNLSVASPAQSKVMVICVDLNTGSLLGSKIFLFGYPPSVISKSFPVNLQCRDYNYDVVECCLSPNVSFIEQFLGFEEHKNGEFHMELISPDSENKLSIKNSCWTSEKIIAAPTLTLDLNIRNVLGNETFRYQFDRSKIQKPYEPKVFITQKANISFLFFVDLKLFGEYFVTVECVASSPIRKNQTLEFNVFGSKSETKVISGWSPNSELSCTLRAKVWLGNASIGQYSDSSSLILRLLEGIPSSGPAVSPLYVDYYSRSDTMLINVIIYFADVGLVESNGAIICYKWKCSTCFIKGINVSGILQTVPKDVRHIDLSEVLVNSNFHITACTKIGCSTSWSKFKIKDLKGDVPNRILSIIRNSIHLTLVWDKEMDVNSLLLLACEYIKDGVCVSIKQMTIQNSKDGIKYIKAEENQLWKFSLISNHDYKLKWVSCQYKSLSRYEVKEKLGRLAHDDYITWNMVCTLHSCYIDVRIKIPDCEIFQDIFICALVISYESINGVKNTKTWFNSSNTANLTIDRFKPGRYPYSMNISVHTLMGDSIDWFNIKHTTEFWCLLYVVVIVICIFIVILIVGFIIWKKRESIMKDYFKRTYGINNRNPVTRKSQFKPMRLLNSDKKDLPTRDNFEVKHEDVDYKCSRDKDSTQSTSVEMTTATNSIDEENLVNTNIEASLSYVIPPARGNDMISKDNLENYSTGESQSYVEPPIFGDDPSPYIHIATPSDKPELIVENNLRIEV